LNCQSLSLILKPPVWRII